MIFKKSYLQSTLTRCRRRPTLTTTRMSSLMAIKLVTCQKITDINIKNNPLIKNSPFIEATLISQKEKSAREKCLSI